MSEIKDLIEEHWVLLPEYYFYMNKKHGENRIYKYNKEEHFQYYIKSDERDKNNPKEFKGDKINEWFANWTIHLLQFWVHKMKTEMETGEELWYHFGA